MKKLILLSAGLALASGLSACGGSSGSKTVVVTPGTGATDPNAKYGAAFAADFKASPDSDPAAVSSGDVVPVDPTAKPSPIS